MNKPPEMQITNWRTATGVLFAMDGKICFYNPAGCWDIATSQEIDLPSDRGSMIPQLQQFLQKHVGQLQPPTLASDATAAEAFQHLLEIESGKYANELPTPNYQPDLANTSAAAEMTSAEMYKSLLFGA